MINKGAQWPSGLECRTGDRMVQGSNPAGGTSLQNVGNSVNPCLSKETLKTGGPFYWVSMPGEAKDPTQGMNV